VRARVRGQVIQLVATLLKLDDEPKSSGKQ
jgi:hypothetical protein